jgi:glycerophosphoryl diester phosphodiesterase
VDDEADLVRLMDWGVDGIFTNVPATMRRLREERQRS